MLYDYVLIGGIIVNGCREVDIKQSAITEFKIMENVVTETDVTETHVIEIDITRKWKLI